MKNFKNLKKGMVVCTAFVLVSLVSCKKSEVKKEAENGQEISSLMNVLPRPISTQNDFPEKSTYFTNDPVYFDMDVVDVVENTTKCYNFSVPSGKLPYLNLVEKNRGVFAQQSLPFFYFAAGNSQSVFEQEQLLKSKLYIYEVDMQNNILNTFLTFHIEKKNVVILEKNPLWNETASNNPSDPNYIPQFISFDANGDKFDVSNIGIYRFERTGFTKTNLNQPISVNVIYISFPYDFIFWKRGKRYKIEFNYTRKDNKIVSQNLFYEHKTGYYCIPSTELIADELPKMFKNPNSDFWQNKIDFNKPSWQKYFIKMSR